MTHKDIYIKFMIEYDKANVTSSYPSLTEYEVATVLDKAYNALIAQKVTGNNVRRSTFESDIKSIADLAPLTVTESMNTVIANNVAPNVVAASQPDHMLYFLQANLNYTVANSTAFKKYNWNDSEESLDKKPFDKNSTRKLPVKLVNHEIAQKFFSSAFNMPWIKEPVCYLEDDKIYVVYDPLDIPEVNTPDTNVSYTNKKLDVVYIKTPNKFVKDLDYIKQEYNTNTATFFDIDTDIEDVKEYQFECNDTVAEELISLAIAFALENIESTRLNAKLNMRGLEA